MTPAPPKRDQALVLPPSVDLLRPSTGATGPDAKPIETASREKPIPQTSIRQRAELPKSQTVSPAAPERVASSPPPMVVQPRPSVEPAPAIPNEAAKLARTGSEPDLLAMLPRTAPREPLLLPESPKPSKAPVTPPSKPAVAADKTKKETPKSAVKDEHVRVNVEELAARISAINMALRTLEADLEGKSEWDADQLDAIVSRLDMLVMRQKDLSMFRDLISKDEQARAGKIESPGPAITRLAAHIAEARKHTRGGDDSGENGEQDALKHLDELSDRLAALASEK